MFEVFERLAKLVFVRVPLGVDSGYLEILQGDGKDAGCSFCLGEKDRCLGPKCGTLSRYRMLAFVHMLCIESGLVVSSWWLRPRVIFPLD
jgi:hypothetical protein